MTGKQRAVKRQLFPEKLWDLVNRPASGIQWSTDGKRIEVERTQLEKYIGTKFRSHNFDSFIRQLHFYGFRKCGNSYHHDKFQRGQPEALHSMRRKYSISTINACMNSTTESPACLTTGSGNNTISSSNDSFDSANNSNTTTGSFLSHSTRPFVAGGDSKNETLAPTLQCKTTRHSNIPIVNGALDLTNLDNDYIIDYSLSRHQKENQKQLALVETQPKTSQIMETNSDISNSKQITLYTLKPSDLNVDCSNGPDVMSSFTNIEKSLAMVDRGKDELRITLPEVVKESGTISWPKTLVLESYWNGYQNILSAYFIYRTNESH